MSVADQGPGGGTGTALQADPTDILRAAAKLTTAGETLRGRAPDLLEQPDAGVSSHEVATALAALSQAVDGLGAELLSAAEATRTSAQDLAGTDQAVGTSMHEQGGGLGR